MAQQVTNYRINRLAKDFNLKSKDILDLLSKNGIEGKTHMATLEPSEFNLLLEVLTSENQIEDLDSYVSGETYIPKKTVVKKTPAGEKEANKGSSKPAVAAAKESKETKPQEKEEVPAAESKDKADTKTETKTEAGAAAHDTEKTQNKQPSSEKTAHTESSQKEKTIKPQHSESENKPAAQETQPAKPRESQRETQRDGRGQNKPQGQHTDNRAENRRDNRTEQGRPEARTERAQRTERTERVERTERTERSERSEQNRSQSGDRRIKNQQTTKPRETAAAEQSGERQVISGRGQVEAPKKNRGPWQPAEGASGEPKQKKKEVQGEARRRTGNTRIVDTRSNSVDLEKYSEHLTSYVSDKDDNLFTKQKLTKQNNRPISSKKRDKERRGMDKLRKEEIERQRRRQLKITIPDEITVGELAGRLKISAPEVIKKLIANGVMATVNQTIDFDTAYLITEELGVTAEREVVVTIEDQLFETEADSEESLVERSPVVCVMGHVDHGKTSLLDAIRHSNVTAGEAGGITQHIGAYRVSIGGKYITFLDTPGHEAFTAMRLRGAMATDIAIIVVAADDGIMPQTVEAINHAKAAGVQIIVAINKMDKPGANPDSIMQELTKYDIVPEEWGGDVMCVPVSAVTKEGISTLLEDILLIAEVEDYKANPARRAQGLVIEAKLDRGRGPVATVLVQNGTLKSGDIVIAGTSVGHVLSMTDETGHSLKTAGPSVPVEITGLSEVPSAGDEFNAVEDEKMARELAEQRRSREKEEMFRANARANLNDMFAQIESGIKDFNIIVKADVKGSAEAVKQSLEKL
ncbi:MAG: translation initiation factor IF-2, partial [Firmicutes bacterium]|nr:translation initiation factor IF-2 [Bacillota bacterium]